MPADRLLAWLPERVPAPISRLPHNLLGAYAAHLSIVEACRALANQPLKVVWSAEIRDPHACAIGRYFDAHGLHDTAFGHAHKRFHNVTDRFLLDPDAWEAAAAELWRTLQEAIKAEARPQPANHLHCSAIDANGP